MSIDGTHWTNLATFAPVFTYTEGDYPRPGLIWTPDSRHFLFRKGAIHIGGLDGNAFSLPDIKGFGAWIDDRHFFADINGGLYIQSMDGTRIPLDLECLWDGVKFLK